MGAVFVVWLHYSLLIILDLHVPWTLSVCSAISILILIPIFENLPRVPSWKHCAFPLQHLSSRVSIRNKLFLGSAGLSFMLNSATTNPEYLLSLNQVRHNRYLTVLCKLYHDVAD